jgi:RND family efflux transporter MFP subunit
VSRGSNILPRAAALLLALALAACGDAPSGSAPAASAAAVETLTVAATSGEGGLAWDGVVQAVEQSVLSAQTSGRVVKLGADVDLPVKHGMLLLRLTDEEQQAAAASAAAQLRAVDAQLADAASRFGRATELVGRQLIARDDFDRVRAAHDSALASRDAAAAQLAQARQQLDYTAVVAPYDAIVAARHVELGETVVPGQPLYTIYAPGQLRLEVLVPQADAGKIRAHPVAQVILADGREVQAAKVIVFPASDPLAHSTAVRVMLPALGAAPRPGQTAKVRFAAAAGPETVWMPASAVVRRGELSAAYVVNAEGIVLRQLRIGRMRADQLEIIAGLAPGEQVAIDPSAALAALRASRHEVDPGRE